MNLKTLALLTIYAVAVPVWAIAQQYRAVHIDAAAEDECPPYYGAWALDEVTGATDVHGHHVICTYR